MGDILVHIETRAGAIEPVSLELPHGGERACRRHRHES